ncbi:hypothetical protein [Rivularia sp. UHCC 0363]|uniref:hypothetical protein n=1 Tax=Rivularia sp. UHCC 0363 TaxID=3110244 RepID=UPI002B212D78|nr:hypothetical protein [Rivularia sp. UHCC 0363]MEA5596303.1 hypothetical protein [Rivularia sp. UHCC 0363]
MNYLIAVYSNRIQGEGAYTALEKAGLPTKQISILGDGYKNADEYGLINPKKQAKNNVQRLNYWLIAFGFAAGYGFNMLTNIEIIPNVGVLNPVIGGLLGAASGILGAFFVGNSVGLTVGSGDALLYRDRLNAGKYLILFEGTEALVKEATNILRSFDPENIQGYAEM